MNAATAARLNPTGHARTNAGYEVNSVVAKTPPVGIRNLTVDSHGILDVHRHFSLYGGFFMGAGATINVDKEVVFDVHRFSPASCPE